MDSRGLANIIWEGRYALVILFFMILYVIYKEEKRREWLPKVVSWVKDLPKEYVSIALIASGVSVACMFLFVNYPFNENGWTDLLKNLLPNIIVDAISIVITAFIVTHFINKAQGRKEKSESFQTIKVHHSMLVNNIAIMYITMMSKKPCLNIINTYTDTSKSYRLLMMELKWAIRQLESRIDDNFFEKKVVYTLKIFPNITPRELDSSRSNAYASKHQYILDYFLESTKEELEIFITKYAPFIPQELTKRIVNLESMILADKELIPWLPNENMGRTSKDYIDTYKELGNSIYALFQYYEEFYQDK